MGTLEIIRRNGEKVRLFSKEPFCTLKSAAQNSSLMGDDNVQLSIVSSELLNLGKGDKIIVYKYKAKKNERKKQGHRQPYTKLKITAIK